MSSIIYIVVIAVIAVISNWNKNKGKSAPRGGMPTFGGGGEGNPLRRPRAPARTADSGRPERPDSGFPEPGGRRGNSGRPDPAPQEREYDASPERPEQPSPDYETGEGMSMEQTGDMDGVQARTERMQRELGRLQAAFDGVAAAVPSTGAMTAGEGASPSQAGTRQHPLAQDREALRSGLVWAEILGPPRSRKPHASVRKEG